MSQQLDALCRKVGPRMAVVLDRRNDAPIFVPFLRDPQEIKEARERTLQRFPALSGGWRSA